MLSALTTGLLLALLAGLGVWIVALKRQIDERQPAAAEQEVNTATSADANYRELVENASDAIFTIDREGYWCSLNQVGHEMTGYDNGPRGTKLAQLVTTEAYDEVWPLLQRVFAGGEVLASELTLISRNGRRRTVEWSGRPLFKDGAIAGCQGMARDVTRRKATEAQVRQAQKMDAIGRLAAGVAHDFNNLLTIILGNCEVTAPLTGSHGPLREAIDDIRAAADRAAALTGQLLAFSRVDMIQPVVVNLDDLIAGLLGPATTLAGGEIESVFLPGHVGSIRADVGQVQRVVMDLAANARDAMPQGGRLTIETQNVRLDGHYVQSHRQVPAGDYVMLAVSDTGAGMAETTRARLFEPFFTTKEIGQGTGLGLATVYGIVKQSGGFVWAYSEPGIGSTLKAYFPSVDAQATPRPIEPRGAQNISGDERILLVEDEDDLRDLLHDYLANLGYRLMSAASGEEALARCRDQTYIPALLISDVVMPGIGGRALAEQLRSADPELKVLYLSGYTDEAMLRHGILPSGTRFLQKPFALEALARTVRLILDNPQSTPSSSFTSISLE